MLFFDSTLNINLYASLTVLKYIYTDKASPAMLVGYSQIKRIEIGGPTAFSLGYV